MTEGASSAHLPSTRDRAINLLTADWLIGHDTADLAGQPGNISCDNKHTRHAQHDNCCSQHDPIDGYSTVFVRDQPKHAGVNIFKMFHNVFLPNNQAAM